MTNETSIKIILLLVSCSLTSCLWLASEAIYLSHAPRVTGFQVWDMNSKEILAKIHLMWIAKLNATKERIVHDFASCRVGSNYIACSGEENGDNESETC